MTSINPTGGLSLSINDSGQVVGGQFTSINASGQYVGGPVAGTPPRPTSPTSNPVQGGPVGRGPGGPAQAEIVSGGTAC